jgi:Ion transport protein
VFFAVDTILNFRTTIIEESTGREITEPKKIAMIYIKSRFIVDLLATVPLDTILEGFLGTQVSGKLSLLSLLKLFRVLRLTKIISYLNTSENIKHSLKIFKLLFFLIIYIHCQACAWFFYTKFD